MKASKELQRKVAALIEPMDTTELRDVYRRGDRFARADRVKDLDRRYRWDLFWSATVLDRSLYDDLDREGLCDDHIDTMLRHTVRQLREDA